MNEGVEQQVIKTINSWGRGKIFFPRDFAIDGNDDSLRHALSSLTEDGVILRLARGIYCYPNINGEYSTAPSIPLPETIAEAVAARDKVRIIPFGDVAARELGLIGMSLSDLKYLTDGSPRTIRLSATTKIVFYHTSEVRMFGIESPVMQKISSAIRYLTAEGIGENEKRIIRQQLAEVDEKTFRKDISLMPAWVQKILIDLY